MIPEPNLGDLGCLEDEDSQEYDPTTLQKIFEEESELNIKNAELIDLISTNSVKMTEEQMREAEGQYQMVGEEEKSIKQVE
jgi:3-deoxy-D-arabino-heptulosonate 7-phosphate (DAHP) synthase